jgi:hypothetical protein
MNKILSLVLTLVLVVGVFGADKYNCGTVTKTESRTQVSYKWVFDFTTYTTDSTDNLHSKALFIPDCNDADGLIYLVSANANTDVDFFLHYSNDNSTWKIGTTDADLNDAAGTTVTVDTVGQAENANALKFHQGTQLVIEADGQNTNDLENGYDITVIVTFTKDGNYIVNESAQYGRILNSKGTP